MNNMNEKLEFTDFLHSFFLWETISDSEGRFNVESITEVICGDKKEEFLLLSSVMACDVYGNNPLFLDPPYLYEAVFGNNDVKIFRTFQNRTRNTINKKTDLFKSTRFLNEKCLFNKLNTFGEIANAVRNGCGLIGRVIYGEETNNRLIVTFPIKHINISEKKKEFQVETGKILCYQGSLENSLLAYLAFKNFDDINFLMQDGNTSKVLNYKAKIDIFTKNYLK